MKNKYILVWGDWDGTRLERYDSLSELEEVVTRILISASVEKYGTHILFSGFCTQELTFSPVEVVTKYKAEKVKDEV